MLSHADLALSSAKVEGRSGHRSFTTAMDSEVRTRLALGAELSARDEKAVRKHVTAGVSAILAEASDELARLAASSASLTALIRRLVSEMP